MSGPYAVVTFVDEKTGDADNAEASEVPSSWLTHDSKKCWWPKTKDISQYISKSVPPDTTSSKWHLYDVICEGIYENLKVARRKAEYMSSSSGDEAGDIRSNSKHAVKLIPDHMDRIPESESDEDKIVPRIPGPPKLTLPKNSTKSGISKTKTISQIDEAQMKITHNNDSVRNINKTNQTQKPTIVQDVTFWSSGPAPPVPKVMCTLPPVPRNSGHDHTFGSISLPLEDNVLQDIMMGSQYTEQFTALKQTIQDYLITTSDAFTELKMSLKAIESRLSEIEKAVNINTVARNHGPDVIAAFPFATEADVMEFEAGIITDENQRRRVTMYLSQIGGNCAKECIRRILSKVFSIPLARGSSWQGHLGNFKVSELKIIDIIKDAVRVSYTCTDKFYEDEAKEWFRQGTQKYRRVQMKAAAKAAGNAEKQRVLEPKT